MEGSQLILQGLGRSIKIDIYDLAELLMENSTIDRYFLDDRLRARLLGQVSIEAIFPSFSLFHTSFTIYTY